MSKTGIVYLEQSNGVVKEIVLGPDQNPLTLVRYLHGLLNEIGDVKFVDMDISVPTISKSGRVVLTDLLGMVIKTKGEQDYIEFSCTPDELLTKLMAVLSTIDLGEKLENYKKVDILNPERKLKEKTYAIKCIKNAIIDANNVLVQKLHELNGGGNMNETIMFLRSIPGKQVQEIMKHAYFMHFGEPFPDPKAADPMKYWQGDAEQIKNFYKIEYTSGTTANTWQGL